MLEILLLTASIGAVAVLAASSIRERAKGPGEQDLFDAEFERITAALGHEPSPRHLVTAQRLGGSHGSLTDIRPGKTPLEILLTSPYGTATVRVPGLTEASLLLDMRNDLRQAEGSYIIADSGDSAHLIVVSGSRRVGIKALPSD